MDLDQFLSDQSARGFSARYWARVIGVSPGYLTRLRKGQRAPSLDTMRLIAEMTRDQVPITSWRHFGADRTDELPGDGTRKIEPSAP